MGKIWFTSDQHYGHRNVIKYCNRPYTRNVDGLDRYNLTDISDAMIKAATQADVEEMNEDLITRHNALISPEDTAIMLGDVSLSFDTLKAILPRLNGTKRLITGNHDFCHPAHPKGRRDLNKWVRTYLELGFEQVNQHLETCLAGQSVMLSHMPYRNSEPGAHGERYTDHRLQDEGKILLHGHVHQHWVKRGRMINVGVDAHGMNPISLDRVIELMNTEGDL